MLDLGMLMIAGAQNPGLGPALDAMGVPMPGAMPADPGLIGGGPQAAAGGQNPLAALSAMKGMNISPAVQAPINLGAKAPEVNVAGLSKPTAIQQAMQALLQRSAGPVVPNLGALVRGAT